MMCGKLVRGNEINSVNLIFAFGKFYKVTNNIYKNPFLVVCDDPICKNTFSIWFIMDYCRTAQERGIDVYEKD